MRTIDYYRRKGRTNKKELNPYGVKVGQIWLDWDVRFRSSPCYKKVIKVTETHAYCESYRAGQSTPIRKTRIRLNRFKPNSTGYKLYEGGIDD